MVHSSFCDSMRPTHWLHTVHSTTLSIPNTAVWRNTRGHSHSHPHRLSTTDDAIHYRHTQVRTTKYSKSTTGRLCQVTAINPSYTPVVVSIAGSVFHPSHEIVSVAAYRRPLSVAPVL